MDVDSEPSDYELSECDSLWDEFDEAMAHMTIIDNAQNEAVIRFQCLQQLLEDTIYVEDQDLEEVLLKMHESSMKEIEEIGTTSFLSMIRQLPL